MVLYAYVISQNFKDTQMVELRKLNQFVYALFTQRKKKALAIARKCLISVWTSQGLNLGPPDYESVKVQKIEGKGYA